MPIKKGSRTSSCHMRTRVDSRGTTSIDPLSRTRSMYALRGALMQTYFCIDPISGVPALLVGHTRPFSSQLLE